MGDPHRKDRYGETWPQYKIDAYLKEMVCLKPFVIISGGWAWHFLSPPGHKELKHAHDHKDLDIYVRKPHVATIIALLKGLGFQKVPTKYDNLPNPEDFRRYEKLIDDGEHKPFRLTIDFFVDQRDIEVRQLDEGWIIVEPETLLSFYTEGHHGSSESFAVRAARKLIEQGIDPQGRAELVQIPNE